MIEDRVTGRVSRRGETDYQLARFLAWSLILIGLEMASVAVGWRLGDWLGMLLGGFILVAWSAISFISLIGKK